MSDMDIRPADIKAQVQQRRDAAKDARAVKQIEDKPTAAEKAATQFAQFGTIAAGVGTGMDVEQATAQAVGIGEAVQDAVEGGSLNDLLAALPGNAEVVNVAHGLAQTEAQQVENERRARTTQFHEQVGAAFSEMTAIPVLLRTLERNWANNTEPTDPSFDYMAQRDLVEAGLPEEDRQFLRESRSDVDMANRLDEVRKRQENYRTLGIHGQGMAIAAGLTGGLVDPVGWAAGLGVGKVAQLAGVGARASLAAGRVGEAAMYGAAEGMTGNVLTEAALDAAGGHVTANDYLIAASMGAVFGQLPLLGKRGPLKEGELPDPAHQSEEIINNAQAMNQDLYTQAQGRLGPEATPEEIRAEVDQIQLEQADFVNRTAFADVPEQDMILPRMDEVFTEDGSLRDVREVLSDADQRADVEARWGITQDTVEDSATRTMMGEIATRAEAWAAANPLDEARADSILARAPWLASTGLTLARSQNPVARMVAGTLLESTTGTTGRRRTAAIAKTLRERVYMEDLVGYETAYKQYRNRTGGSAYRDVLGSDHRAAFDRAVALERENRRLGGPQSSDPAIKHAADVLDAGYNRMRLDQQRAGTVGAARLGDTSVGYVHRSISAAWVMRATNSEIKALSNKLAEQLELGWGDAEFARTIAARYVERARTGAYGGTSVPANLASPEAASALRDTMRAMGVAEQDIERAMGRFSRGGASHTKKRLDLDLSERVTTDDGKTFTLMDAFDMDQAGLYMNYARRVSGDVALTQYGVLGDAGMATLRKALEYGPDGKRATAAEMRAFDQIAAEFYGRPLDGTGNKHLGNLRMLTAASRLGGMAFTQFAEMANSVALLGVTGALKNVAAMPRLIGDVMAGKPSPLLSSIEQVGGPLGQDHRVIFPYQEPNDIKVYGQDSLNAFDRMVRAGSNALPWLSGWHYVHAAQVRGISEQIVHKSFRYIRNGEENAALTSMGISSELAAKLKADLPNIAEFDEAGTLVALDLSKASDPAAVAEYVQAVHRGGRQIIQGTYIGETGAWAHNDLLRLLVQFRSFSLTSMEKQWTRQRVDVGTAKAFGILAGQMAFALPIHLARVSINATGRDDKEKYLETQLHPAMLARAVLNYTSISGLAGDVLDAGASVAGYEASGVRTGNGSVLGNIPALGYVDSTVKAVIERDPKQVIRSLPGGNLPYLTPVVNAAASGN